MVNPINFHVWGCSKIAQNPRKCASSPVAPCRWPSPAQLARFAGCASPNPGCVGLEVLVWVLDVWWCYIYIYIRIYIYICSFWMCVNFEAGTSRFQVLVGVCFFSWIILSFLRDATMAYNGGVPTMLWPKWKCQPVRNSRIPRTNVLSTKHELFTSDIYSHV